MKAVDIASEAATYAGAGGLADDGGEPPIGSSDLEVDDPLARGPGPGPMTVTRSIITTSAADDTAQRQRAGLPEHFNLQLFALIVRSGVKKGCDLPAAVTDQLLHREAQLVVPGKGRPRHRECSPTLRTSARATSGRPWNSPTPRHAGSRPARTCSCRRASTCRPALIRSRASFPGPSPTKRRRGLYSGNRRPSRPETASRRAPSPIEPPGPSRSGPQYGGRITIWWTDRGTSASSTPPRDYEEVCNRALANEPTTPEESDRHRGTVREDGQFPRDQPRVPRHDEHSARAVARSISR